MRRRETDEEEGREPEGGQGLREGQVESVIVCVFT